MNGCWIAAQGAAIAQPRLALAAAGGAPLLGSASTLGMRIGSTPRVALQLRASGARLTMPASGSGAGASSLVSALSLDAAVGLTQGMSPAPTIGGVGSIDLLGSLGVVHPGGRFDGSPGTFGAGARVGVLRESFTTPGISLSAMIRRTGGTSFTTPTDSARASFSHIADVALRATVAKRFLPIGTLVGVGLDRTSGDVTILPPPCPAGAVCAAVLPPPVVASLTQTRANFFADLTWTSLVFNAVAEVGWQRGGSPAPLISPTGYEPLVRKSALFGSLGIRLTI